MTTSRLFAYVLASVLAVWCAWYLYAHFDWSAVFELLGRAKLGWLFAAGGASTLGYFLVRALRWRAILPRVASSTLLGQLYLITAITVGLSIVTPGHLGEAIKIELLKRNDGPGRLLGTGAFLTERLIDAGIIATVAVVGLSVYMPYADLAGVHAVAWMIVGLVAAGTVIALSVKWRGKLRELATPVLVFSRDRTAFGRVLILSLASWALVALGWLFALRSVDVNLGFLQVLWLAAVVVIVQIASLIPGGIGISDLLTVSFWRRSAMNRTSRWPAPWRSASTVC